MRTMTSETYTDGVLVSTETIELPDTKLDKAMAALNAIDPSTITTLQQAKAALILHNRILRYIIPHLVLDDLTGTDVT